MLPGPFLLTESDEPTVGAANAHVFAADQPAPSRQVPLILVVSGALAIQPGKDLAAARLWDAQVIQIGATPEFVDRLAQQTVDHLFLAMGRTSVAEELSQTAATSDTFVQLDLLQDSNTVTDRNHGGAAGLSDSVDAAPDLDRAFEGSEDDWNDFHGGTWL